MKIELDAFKIYETLKNPVLDIESQFYSEALKQIRSGESWKSGEKPKQKVKTQFLKSSILFNPLENMIVAFDRIGEEYNGRIILSSHSASWENQLSKRLKEIYGDGWLITNNENAYGFLTKDGEAIIEVSKGGLGGADREITLVKAGAQLRDFRTLEDFITDIAALEKFTNVYINERMKQYAQMSGTSDLPPDTFTLRFG